MCIIRKLVAEKGKPLFMGIIKCTPDSFYAPSRKTFLDAVLREAEKMVSGGADIIDIGGESTRPGSLYVDEKEEIARVIPAVREIASRFSVPVSVDTRKGAVAEKALESGASIVNDISSLCDDDALAAIVRDSGADLILMHRRGTPKDMQDNPYYSDTVAEIWSELEISVKKAVSAGIDSRKITIDPGIGFGKRVEDNIEIIRNLEFFSKKGFPLLVGYSRKSFIGAVTGKAAEERLSGSLAAAIVCAMNGADVLRVHDPTETVDALKVFFALSDRQGRKAGKEKS